MNVNLRQRHLTMWLLLSFIVVLILVLAQFF